MASNAMTSVKIACNCGCGYNASTLEEAIQHCQATGHCMSILGEVRPGIEPVAEYSQEEG